MRTFDWDKPLSEADLSWIKQSGIKDYERRAKQSAVFKPAPEEATASEEEAEEVSYKDMTAAELKALAAEREISLEGVRTKGDLVHVLEEWDRS